MRATNLAVLIIGFVCAVTSLGAHATVILNVTGGQLTGAQNVDVNGSLFNVAFIEGSCITVFSGCDNVSDLNFTVESAAQAAADALLEQVFVNTVDGMFDAAPELTAGCTSGFICSAIVPYGFNPNTSTFDPNTGTSSFLLTFDAVNQSGTLGDATLPTGTRSIGFNTASGKSNVYAFFSAVIVLPPPPPPAPVPEPGTLGLLGAGLLGLGFVRRKKAA